MSRQSKSITGHEPQGEAPCALDYLDYRAFLRDVINTLCQRNARLSQRGLALRAGFKAPHLLGMILAGQRSLAADKLPALARALRLTASDEAYVGILLDLEAARSVESRAAVLRRIQIEFHAGLFSHMGQNGSELLRGWVPLAVRELVLLPDFTADPRWMAARLGVQEKIVRESFEALSRLGFLVKIEERWVKAEPSIHNFGRFAPMVVAQYNLEVLQKACEAVAFPNSERYFESLTMAVPKALVPQLKSMIKRFMREVDVLVESHGVRDEVWLLGTQLLNLTRAPAGERTA